MDGVNTVTVPEISASDFMKISHDLERYHAVFYQLWEMGVPSFTESIPTACVTFNKEGQRMGFLFNPSFYAKLSEYERQFIICHECLHVILNHGVRISGMNASDPHVNIALDIVVNHLLVDRFGFVRGNLPTAPDLCWIDTVFKDQIDVLPDQCFEYYYKKLQQEFEKSGGSCGQSLADDHQFLGQSSDVADIIDHLNDSLSNQEKETIQSVVEKYFENTGKNQRAGTSTGGVWAFANVGYVKPKKKWETVIKKWSKKFLTEFRDKEQWARINRRFAAISTNMFLPSEMEEDDVNPKKITVWFFQDTSGSCAHLKDRFFKAAMSLPSNRFGVKMHCFDTQVFETDLESKKLYGFGGTSFSCIENYIQHHKADDKYPEAVFVITDGYANSVFPQIPQKWHWFLTTNYTDCIPKECNIYNLQDFE